jgi:predicted transposase YbfD/YdcC
MLDVNFREDGCRARKDNSPKNLNILRKAALSRLRAGLVPQFLQKILFGG